MAHTGPPLKTQFTENGLGSLNRIELTTQPIAHPANANAARDEISYCLKANQVGNPRANSAAYAYGNMDVKAVRRVERISFGDNVPLVTVHRKKNTSGVVTGASKKA